MFFRLWGSTPRLQGVLARPGTQDDPMSDIFFTKWVAIPPFWTSEAGFDAEFRRGRAWSQIRPISAQGAHVAPSHGSLRRIPLRISPDRSNPLYLNFF